MIRMTPRARPARIAPVGSSRTSRRGGGVGLATGLSVPPRDSLIGQGSQAPDGQSPISEAEAVVALTVARVGSPRRIS